jgi:hypothetical protein
LDESRWNNYLDNALKTAISKTWSIRFRSSFSVCCEG